MLPWIASMPSLYSRSALRPTRKTEALKRRSARSAPVKSWVKTSSVSRKPLSTLASIRPADSSPHFRRFRSLRQCSSRPRTHTCWRQSFYFRLSRFVARQTPSCSTTRIGTTRSLSSKSVARSTGNWSARPWLTIRSPWTGPDSRRSSVRTTKCPRLK
ncbi:MAG: hypothetical protein CEN87_171 [Parcubacteria group bacterium Licking1014_1]|nr:MAG: hypothetical protein CEN87_171 [Parcubacteria group bacterium Licking1014_1]